MRPEGSTAAVSAVPVKAPLPMAVMLSCRFRSDSAPLAEKAASPSSVTLSGRATAVKLSQWEKARSPMETTPSGSATTVTSVL